MAARFFATPIEEEAISGLWNIFLAVSYKKAKKNVLIKD